MASDWSMLLDEIEAARAARQLAKAHSGPNGLSSVTSSMRRVRQAPRVDMRQIQADLDAMAKSLPPAEPSPRDQAAAAQAAMRARLAKCRTLLKALVDGRQIGAIDAAKFEARINHLGASLLR